MNPSRAGSLTNPQLLDKALKVCQVLTLFVAALDLTIFLLTLSPSVIAVKTFFLANLVSKKAHVFLRGK